MAHDRCYSIADGAIVISMDAGSFTRNFVAVARSRKKMAPISDLASEMGQFPDAQCFHVAYARN